MFTKTHRDQYLIITVFPVFRLLTDFVCLYTYEFWLSLYKIARSSVILLLPLFNNIQKNEGGIGDRGNNCHWYSIKIWIGTRHCSSLKRLLYAYSILKYIEVIFKVRVILHHVTHYDRLSDFITWRPLWTGHNLAATKERGWHLNRHHYQVKQKTSSHINISFPQNYIELSIFLLAY